MVATHHRDTTITSMQRTQKRLTEHWCNCFTRQTPKAAAKDLKDELAELIRNPSTDEWSDVWFAIGRLLGAYTNQTIVATPFTKRHWDKITQRMTEHGCIRSKRHLVNGTCPTDPTN